MSAARAQNQDVWRFVSSLQDERADVTMLLRTYPLTIKARRRLELRHAELSMKIQTTWLESRKKK